MSTKSYDAFLMEQLRDPELAAAYLSAAIEDQDIGVFLIALRNVTEAHGGIGRAAEGSNLNRQSLYRMLSKDGNPTLASLLPLLREVGVNLTFVPAPNS